MRTSRRTRAPSPLFWIHVNPYGRFELDMSNRLNLHPAVVIPGQHADARQTASAEESIGQWQEGGSGSNPSGFDPEPEVTAGRGAGLPFMEQAVLMRLSWTRTTTVGSAARSAALGSALILGRRQPGAGAGSGVEVLGEEEGGPVEGLIGFIEQAGEGLEDVRHASRDVQDDVDLGVPGTLGQAHRVVQ